MTLDETQSYYEVLDITPHASIQDIREGYLRAKAAFNKDNVALYTIFTSEEREEALKKIEEAYLILSDAVSRQKYDISAGLIKPESLAVDASTDTPIENLPPVISIDRVPPMENRSNIDELLIPPVTDIRAQQRTAQTLSQNQNNTIDPPPAFPTFRDTRPPTPIIDPSLRQDIEIETEWSGTFIKKVREAYKISLEEMVGITKVTKSYLTAIEEENYQKLPAPVYIRGFVIQIAKVLKLPHEKVATGYLSRYYQNNKRS